MNRIPTPHLPSLDDLPTPDLSDLSLPELSDVGDAIVSAATTAAGAAQHLGRRMMRSTGIGRRSRSRTRRRLIVLACIGVALVGIGVVRRRGAVHHGAASDAHEHAGTASRPDSTSDRAAGSGATNGERDDHHPLAHSGTSS